MSAHFTRDTEVTAHPKARGLYTAHLADHWSFRTPSGGVLMTIALRAMEKELAEPELIARSANTLFCSPVPAGPLEIRVEVLRRGGAAAQVRAALSSTLDPGPGLEVSATFARDRDGPSVLDSAPRAVAKPEDAPPLVEPGRWPFLQNFEVRLAEGHKWWESGWSAASEARFSRWMRYLEDPRRADGSLDPFALPAIADLMPTALLMKLGPDHPRYFAPSLDLTVHFLEPAKTKWVLASAHVRHARSGYASADVEIWDEDGRLAAFATQTMFLRRRPP